MLNLKNLKKINKLTAIGIILSIIVGYASVEISQFNQIHIIKKNLKEETKKRVHDVIDITLKGRLMGALETLGMTSIASKLVFAFNIGNEKDLNENIPIMQSFMKDIGEKQIDSAIRTASIYVAGYDGTVIAQWRNNDKLAKIVDNLSFRPYFQQGIQGLSNIYPAVSTSTKLQQIYYAAPVTLLSNENTDIRSTQQTSDLTEPQNRKIQPVIGVVVARLDLSTIENLFLDQETPYLLISPQGVVFLSNHKEFVYNIVGEILKQRLQEIDNLKQFGHFFETATPELLPFDIYQNETIWQGRHLAISQEKLDWHDPYGTWTLVLTQDIQDSISLSKKIKIFSGSFFISLIIIFLSIRLIMSRKLINDQLKVLKKSEEDLIKILDSSPMSVAIFFKGDIKFANKPFLNSFGIKLGDKAETLYVNPSDNSQIFEKVFDNDLVHTDEILMFDHLNQSRMMLRSCVQVDYDDSIAILGWFLDITDQQQTTEALRRAKDLALETAQLKSDFLANMSHEIRTPMNAIIGMTNLVLQTKLNEQQKNYISKANNAAENLLSIINDILDFSKIESGKYSIENIPFDINVLLSNLSSILGKKISEKGVELLYNVSSKVPRNLIGDPFRIGQVLLNLVDNASKFTHSGEIIISIVPQETRDETVILEFSVKDTGIGMSEDQCHRIFQPFSQADASITRKYGGTGLGLAISKQIVNLMGGALWVKSVLNEGSDFHFTVKLLRNEQLSSPKQTKEKSLPAFKTLIVDDHQLACDILSSMTQQLNFPTDCVLSGYKAIQALEQAYREGKPYDLVFIDWVMPQLDGLDTIEKIVELNIKQPLFILITSHITKDPYEIIYKKNLPIFSVLTKPITQSTLLDTLQTIIYHDTEPKPKIRDDLSALEVGKPLYGARILLVEDNEINKELASEYLKMFKMIVTTVDNGLEALNLLKESSEFDGILMDCQMPVMDGYTATEKIRQIEKYKSLPIIAITANVMEEDKEKILACGMNDIICKPINPLQMLTTMAKWIKPKDQFVNPPDQTEINYSDKLNFEGIEGFDTNRGLQITGNNQDLYRRLLYKFLNYITDFESQFRSAIKQKDWESATRQAHSLKGSAGNLGAKDLHKVAEMLEQACHSKDFNKVHIELTLMLTHIETIIKSLTSWRSYQTESESDVTDHSDQFEKGKEVSELYQLLISQLKNYSGEAIKTARKLKNQSNQNIKFGFILNLIEDFQYDEALSELNKENLD